jgi:hypothetical protein
MTLDLEVNEVEIKGLTSLASITGITGSMTDRSVTTIIVVLLISYPMMQQNVDIANDGGTDIYRRRLQNRQMSVCHRYI